MIFGQPLSGVTVPSRGCGKPSAGTYKMHVIRVEDTVSKTSGNPMIVIHLDISEGKHVGFFKKNPLRLYLPYTSSNPEAASKYSARIKEALQYFYKSNPGMLSEEDLVSAEFDQNRLCGLSVWACIDVNDKNYLAVRYLTDAPKDSATTVTAATTTETEIVGW